MSEFRRVFPDSGYEIIYCCFRTTGFYLYTIGSISDSSGDPKSHCGTGDKGTETHTLNCTADIDDSGDECHNLSGLTDHSLVEVVNKIIHPQPIYCCNFKNIDFAVKASAFCNDFGFVEFNIGGQVNLVYQ